MADTPAPNGGAQAEDCARPMPLNALAQYAKDFSFENPNAPRSLAPAAADAPQINIQVNVNAKQLAETDFEVELTLEGTRRPATRCCSAFELTMRASSASSNMPQDSSTRSS